MILPRFSRSASASRAIARCMVSGSSMSLSSTSSTSTPHFLVVTSRISLIDSLSVSVSASTWSSGERPTTLRTVVCAIWLIAASTSSISTIEATGSTRRK